MSKNRWPHPSLVLGSFLLLGGLSAVVLAADLSKYRDLQFGADLATVAGQVGTSPSRAKVVHSRPALVQELEWRPQGLGPSSRVEAASEVVFTFYKGELFRIQVNYDRYKIEGLTAEDLIGAISAIYGAATLPDALAGIVHERHGEEEELLAQWRDPHHRFDLVRLSYGPRFRLIGVLTGHEALARAAAIEAARLDEQDAPQREAERIATEQQAERIRLENSRRVNKPAFRP